MIEQNSQKPSPYALTSGVPKIKTQAIEAASDSRKIGNWIMIACCVPMVAGAGLLLWAMGNSAGWSERIYALAPLAACLGAHLLMHKFVGKSCHGDHNTTKTKDHSNEKTS